MPWLSAAVFVSSLPVALSKPHRSFGGGMAGTITDAIGRVDRLIAEASTAGPAAAHSTAAMTTAAPAVPGTDAAANGASTPSSTPGDPWHVLTRAANGTKLHVHVMYHGILAAMGEFCSCIMRC